MESVLMKIAIFVIIFFMFNFIMYGKTPSSKLSLEVVSKKEPLLKEEFIKKGMKYGNNIFIRIFKKEKELEIWVEDNKKYKLFKIYNIASYGNEGLGPKVKEGDGFAPEGFYFVNEKRMNPYSSYHLSFNLGYPNEYDRIHKRTGSALMVHGSFVSIGCYAMTDENIEEIYTIADKALNEGQINFQVNIFPFRMEDEILEEYKEDKWYEFWKNLKEGYDYFEKNKIPPEVDVKNKNYIFK